MMEGRSGRGSRKGRERGREELIQHGVEEAHELVLGTYLAEKQNASL